MEAFQVGSAALDALEFRMQVVKEKRADNFENVALVGVMPADLTAFPWLHDCLEKRTENSGRDARPIERRTRKKNATHFTVKIGKAKIFGK